MRRPTAFFAVLACSAFFTVAGCGNSPQADEAAVDATSGDDGKEDSAHPGLYTCKVDSDCVAVASWGCCPKSHKVAVAKSQLHAYQQLHTSLMVCNEQIVCAAPDTRVAECNTSTNRCKMIEPQDIRCGGFIINPHTCPKGFSCDYYQSPDVPGYCIESENAK